MSERLALPLFVVYLHLAVCALVDIPHLTPDWLDEVGGRAP